MRNDFKIKKETVALVIVDMQRYFCDEQSDAQVPLAAVVIKIKKLIDIFNENNRPIIFTRHIDSDDKDNMMLRWWKEQIKEHEDRKSVV